MPRASLNPDKAKQGGGSFEAGIYEITAAKTQNIKTDYKANQPYLVLVGMICDADSESVRGADETNIQFGFGEKSLQYFHPGEASSRDDDDPADQGDEVDAEGNTIYAIDADEQFNKSCGAIVFAESLKKLGFPTEVLDTFYCPDFVGAKFHIESKTAEQVNKMLGTRLNTKPTSDGNTVTYKVATKWLNAAMFGGGKNAAAAKVGAKANGKASAKPAAAEPAADDAGTGDALADNVKSVLATIAAAKAGKSVANVQQLVAAFTQENAKSKTVAVKELVAAQKLIKNEEWLAEALNELGVDYTAGEKIEFPG
jgi:hypothetical protein